MLNFSPFVGSKKEGGPMDVAFWMSFSPMAPLFGVKYRFADMFKFDPAFTPNFDVFMPTAKTTKTPAKPKAKKAKAPAKPTAKKAKAPEPIQVELKVEPIAKPAVKAETPVAPKAKVEKAPVEAPAATDRPATLFDAPPAKTDDLKLIKGVGPKLEGMLNGLGIYTFEQVAGFSEAELQWVDDNLTSFKGRAFRDDWISQAKALMAQ